MSYIRVPQNVMIFQLFNYETSSMPNQHRLFFNYEYVLNCFNAFQSQKTSSLLTQCDTNNLQLPSNAQLGTQIHQRFPAVDQNLKRRTMERSAKKEILSAKKNSQSNIINQFYSFFSHRFKSQKIVENCARLIKKQSLQIQKILPIFYMTIRFINCKRGRKYVNMAMFLKLFTEEQFSEYLSEIKYKFQQLGFLNIDELCQIFRRCARYFFKQVSINAILTSKRISIVSKSEHLRRRRKLLPVIGNL